MSISSVITRIQTARNKIRTWLVGLGLGTSTDSLDAIATKVEAIENQGSVSAMVQEGDTYTIPKGYHNGSGTVSGVAGGGNYSLQSKSVTPTKSQQNVTPSSGYYGLSDVTVAAIPENFNDTSAVTAEAADVLANTVIVDADGNTVAGTMPNIGTVNKTLDTSTKSYTVPKGYHSGSGSVNITTEEKSVTPTKSAQTILATSGKVISKVSVGKIPDAYQDVTGTTATAAHVLDGDIFVNASGVSTEGTMPNNGAVSNSMDGLTTTSVSIPAGYTTGGTVSLTNDIETALAAI